MYSLNDWTNTSNGQRSRCQSALPSKELEASEGRASAQGDLSEHLRKLYNASLTTFDVKSVHNEMEKNARSAVKETVCIEDLRTFLEISRETARVKQKAPKNTFERRKSLTIGANRNSNLLGSTSMIDLRTPRRGKRKNDAKLEDEPVGWQTSFDIDAPRNPLANMETSSSRSHRTVDTKVGNEIWDHFDPLSASNRTMDSAAFSTCDILPIETIIGIRTVEERETKKERQEYKEALRPHLESKSRSRQNSLSKTPSRSNATNKRETERSTTRSNSSRRRSNRSSSLRHRAKLNPMSPKRMMDQAMFEMFNWSSSSSHSDLKAATSTRDRLRGSSGTTERTASMPSLRNIGRSKDISL